ncbi:unnamed protein product [Rodentolepis nana]|uniref:Uncharacterized protein n=1 Tax=Rodentolepis nana TaxID=102285 RepID=A0A0R3T9W9_RODNA|nr:unnamed protein product [Rodentolepis nana]
MSKERSPEDTQINLQPPWNDLKTLSFSSQTIQHPVFHHNNNGEACTSKRDVNVSDSDQSNGLYMLHSNTLGSPTDQQSCSYLTCQTTKSSPPFPQRYRTIILRSVGHQPAPAASQLLLPTSIATTLRHQNDRILISNGDHNHTQAPSPCSSTCTENNTFV